MPIIRLPNGSLRDEVRQPLYDTIDIDAAEPATGTRSYFSDVQGKPRSLTNLTQNNLLETAKSFRCQGLAWDAQNFYEANAKALALIMEHSSLRFIVGEKDYLVLPGVFAAGRVEQNAAVAVPAAAPLAIERLHQKYGQGAVAAVVLTGKHVVDINPVQSFRVDWVVEGMTATEITATTPAANTKLRFTGSLKGLLRRPVQ